MNVTILQGRLTRDPSIRYTQGENALAIARYTLAVDRQRRQDGEQGTDFIPCVAFGGRAEFAEKYLKQGTKIAIRGHIQTGSYTNRDGNKVYTTEVVVDEHDFCESRNASQGYSSASAYNGQQNYQNQGNYGNSNQQGTGRPALGTYSDPRAYQNQSAPAASGSMPSAPSPAPESRPMPSAPAPGPMPSAPVSAPSMGTQNGGFTPNAGRSNNTGSQGLGYHQDPTFGEGFMNIPDGIEEELPFN